MNILIGIFLINNIVSAEISSDETKYIDLLPEKEKEEFLEGIARRLFDNTHSKENQDQVSGEVSEASLENHNHFIKTVLKQESLNLRRRDGDIYIDTKKQDNSSEHINLINEKTARDETREDDHIDLTLLEGTRKRRNRDIKNVNHNYKIIKIQPGNPKNDNQEGSDTPEDNIKIAGKDSKITFLNKDFKKNEPPVGNKKIDTPETDFDNVVHESLSEESILQPKEKDETSEAINLNENKDTTTESENIKHKDYIRISNKPYESQENRQIEYITRATLATETDVLSTTNEPTSNDEIISQLTTDYTNMALIENVGLNALKLRYTDGVTLNPDKIIITNHTTGSENPELHETNVTVAQSTSQDHNYTNVLDTSDKINAEIAILTTVTPLETTTDTKHVVYTMKPEKAKLSVRSLDEIDVNTNNVFTKIDLITKTSTDINVGLKRNRNFDSGNNKSSNLANDMIKVIRPGVPVFYRNNFKDLKAMDATVKKKEYNVYEISPNEDPFIQKTGIVSRKQKGDSETLNMDQPYYVPVYNYSPNNAYYDPRNRLGPNDNDNENDIVNPETIDKDHLKEIYNNGPYDEGSHTNIVRRDVNNESDMISLEKTNHNWIPKDSRKFRFGYNNKKGKDYLHFKLNLPVVVRYPKVTELYINSNDYLDMDYYYGRSNEPHNSRSIAVSPETDSTPDNMKLKNYVRDIRLMLYKQNHIDPVLPLRSKLDDVKEGKPIKNSRSEKFAITKQNDINPTDSNIAMDYFFGRMNDDIDGGYKPTFTYEKSPEVSIKKRFKVKSSHVPKASFNQNTDGTSKHDSDNFNPATSANQMLRFSFFKKKKPIQEPNFEKIKEILSIVDAEDLVPTLNKLIDMNIARNGVDIEPYVVELRSMILNSSRALKQYDWLGTTVDIQAALAKVIAMIDALRNNQMLSAPDMQLLKYCIYLHESLKDHEHLRKKLLPKNKRKRKKKVIKDKGLYNRVWLFRMLVGEKSYKRLTDEELLELRELLTNVRFYLNDLHLAILEISSKVNYRTQRWFENLQIAYFNSSEKQILEVLLHLTITRLIDLVENSARNGLQEDFLKMKNDKEVIRTKTELEIAMKIVDELNRLHRDRQRYTMKINYLIN